MLRKVLCVLLAAAMLPLPYSCSRETGVESRLPEGPADVASDEAELARIEDELRAAPEVAMLLRIRSEIEARVAPRVMSEEWEEAYRKGNYEEMARLAGYTSEERALVRARLESLAGALETRYPVLRRLAEEVSAGGCAPAGLAAAGDDFEVPDPYKKGQRPFVCKWGPFTVGLIACAAATIAMHGNPVVFLLCTYQVICANCTGGMADRICA
jgi:hypothetical protein